MTHLGDALREAACTALKAQVPDMSMAKELWDLILPDLHDAAKAGLFSLYRQVPEKFRYTDCWHDAFRVLVDSEKLKWGDPDINGVLNISWYP